VRKKEHGLFLSYSYAADWRHPYFFPRDTASAGCPCIRPDYGEPQPEYLYEKEEDFFQYIKFAHNQLEELLYRYPGVAGVCLAPLEGYYCRPDLFPTGLTYETIRTAQPRALISFGRGATGGEDFVALRRGLLAEQQGGELGGEARRENQGKPLEIRESLQPEAWGYDERAEGKHRTADDVMNILEGTNKGNANLLLNTGLLPDGAVHPDDAATLLEVGKRLKV
jgi:alpha-L-fucosidase